MNFPTTLRELDVFQACTTSHSTMVHALLVMPMVMPTYNMSLGEGEARLDVGAWHH